MPSLVVVANYQRPFGPVQTQKEGLRHYLNQLLGVQEGTVDSQSVGIYQNDGVAVDSASFSGPAIGILAGSSLAGAVGGTIGGTLVTATAAGGDIATQTLVAAAIRANTTVNQFVTASNVCARMTLASVVAGTTVNVGNITFTAVATAAAIRNFGEFNIDGSDTADAAALALAINRHPALQQRIRAVSIAGVVHCVLLDSARATRAVESISNPSASTITVNQATFIPAVTCFVIAAIPGVIGNFVTVVASGTGMTYSTNGTAGQLGNGTGAYRPLFSQNIVL